MNLITRQILMYGILILLAFGHSLSAQTLLYDIYKGDEVIGEITVEKRIEGDEVHYEANSAASFRLLFSNDLTTHTSSAFRNDELHFASSKILLNGKTRDHNITRREGGYYHFFQHPDEETKVKAGTPFPNSTTALYYAEPVGVKEVFSENYQQLCPMKVIGANAYELTLPGGKVNQYFYEKGQLVEIKVIRTFMDLSFRLKSRS